MLLACAKHPALYTRTRMDCAEARLDRSKRSEPEGAWYSAADVAGSSFSASSQTSAGRATVVTSFYLALALVGFLWHAVDQEDNDVWRTRPDVDWLTLLWTPVLGLALGLAVVFAFRLLERRAEWLPALHREFRTILGRPPMAEIVLLAAASSIGEEIFFRGAMLDAWGPWLSSLVFALLHVPPKRELWPWTLSAGLLGLMLAWLTQWTGNLGPAIVAHFVINLINFTYITRFAPPIVLRRVEPR
jgi:membrane protease YdiL (CAAX protease family)